MDEVDELDSIAILQIHGGDGDGAELVFDFNNHRISVSIFPSSPTYTQKHGSIQDRIVDLLNHLSSGDVEDSERDEIEDEVMEVILDAGRVIFRAQTTSSVELDAPPDLHSVIYVPMLHFQLCDNSGKADIVSIAPSEAYTVLGDEAGSDSQEDELGINATLPCYSSRAILITEMLVEGAGHWAGRVLVDGADMFCKAQESVGGLVGTSVGRELGCLQEIRNDTMIRVPQLLGYVRHANTDRIVGLLRQWIPGRRLRDIGVLTTSAERRQKWFMQIREAVYALHDRGIIWGDGKAGNVVIDEKDDAWLVDFGGGWTERWVDEELADTVEGDAQALGRTANFLGMDQGGGC